MIFHKSGLSLEFTVCSSDTNYKFRLTTNMAPGKSLCIIHLCVACIYNTRICENPT